MARRPPTPPQEPVLSPVQMRTAIARFQRRLGELEAFEPKSVEARKDPRIDTLEGAIGEALGDAFGYRTPTYQRYSAATSLTLHL